MSRTAFVTGGTGFLGRHVVGRLLDQGWRVTVLARDPRTAADLGNRGAVVHQGDVTDPASLARGVPAGVDCVFHLAADTSIWSRRRQAQDRVNVDGTRHVVRAALEAGAARLVHTSSFTVWGFVDGVLTEETEPVARDGWINYIRSKRAGEAVVRAAVDRDGLDAVICNPAHILGPGDRRSWARMILMVDRGTLPGVPPGGGAFADVREVARAHLAAWERGRRGANYLLGGPDSTFLEAIRVSGELLGRAVPRRASPAWQIRLAGRLAVLGAALTGREPVLTPEGAALVTHHVRCDSSRAQRELHYRFTPLRQLLQDSCDWLREEGLLR